MDGALLMLFSFFYEKVRIFGKVRDTGTRFGRVYSCPESAGSYNLPSQ
jgi:hypothetical protein